MCSCAQVHFEQFLICNYFLIDVHTCMYVCVYICLYIYKKCWNQQNVLLYTVPVYSYFPTMSYFYHLLSQCGFPVSCCSCGGWDVRRVHSICACVIKITFLSELHVLGNVHHTRNLITYKKSTNKSKMVFI